MSDRTQARVALIVSAALLGFGLALLIGGIPVIRSYLGVDLALYLERTRAWLSGDGFYLPRQLAGPYVVAMGDALYPPIAILLFLPFLIVPAPLWWLLPVTSIGLAVRRLRPRPWTWPVMAVCLVMPSTLDVFIYGNPTMWAAAFVALGTVWRWPAVLVAFKPTLLPFALIGARSRAAWLTAGIMAVASAAFLTMNLDYVTVVLNARGDLGYLFGSVPLVALPVVAMMGRGPRSADALLRVPGAGVP